MQQDLGQIYHEQRQVDCVGHGGFFDIHKVFQAPILFGISEIELDFEPETVIVDDGFIGEFQIAGKQIDIGKDAGLEVGLGNDDHIKDLGKLVVQHVRLIDAGLDAVFDAILDQILVWNVAVVDLLAIFLAWPFASLLTIIHERQGGIITQLGNQM